MTKSIILACLVILGCNSCKKDYNCDCTIVVHSDDGNGVTTNSTSQVTYPYENSTKTDAQEQCDLLDNSDASSTMGNTVTTVDYTCMLK